MSSWSRSAVPHLASARGSEAGPILKARPDPEALSELIESAPRNIAASTGEDGGTLLGSDTRLPLSDASAAPDPAARPIQRARIAIGEATTQPQMASPAIERAARAQLYWNLVQRCRDSGDKILPPDAVTLVFTINSDGHIVASSIVASAANPEHEAAALCMRRELSAAAFHGPASARGMATRITATIPSVD